MGWKTYGTIGKVKERRDKIHEYFGMKLDYNQKGKVIIYMVEYVELMVKSFPEKDSNGNKVEMPWNHHLLMVRYKSPYSYYSDGHKITGKAFTPYKYKNFFISEME